MLGATVLYCCGFSYLMVNKMLDSCYEKVYVYVMFMLGCSFTFEAYAKDVREKATKCSLKSTGVYWMLMDMCLPMFDLYQGMVARNCFKSHTTSWCLDFPPK